MSLRNQVLVGKKNLETYRVEGHQMRTKRHLVIDDFAAAEADELLGFACSELATLRAVESIQQGLVTEDSLTVAERQVLGHS